MATSTPQNPSLLMRGVDRVRPATLPVAATGVVGCVVVVAAIAYWLLGRRLGGLWIMPDEAIYGERALRLWHDGRLPLFHSEGAGYGVLYPALAGLPLSLGKLTTGYTTLKAVQAVVMSLAALPVYLYGRRLARPGWAAAAAALTVASPLLLYSGLLMTEVLIYPLGALALLSVARAVESPSLGRQVAALALIGAAVLTRVQSVVLVAIFAAAVLVDAVLGGGRRRLRSFWPLWAVLAAAAAVTFAAPGVFGAYAGTVQGSYPIRNSVGLVVDHLSYLVLSTGVAPAVALGILAIELARGRVRDPGARALASVALSAVVLVTLQVGFFAARYAPHLLGRDLALLPPVLFLVLAVWLDRGALRARDVSAMVAGGVLALLALTPWHHLVSIDALPDTFGIVLLYHYGSEHSSSIVAAFGVVMLAALLLLPRRLLLAVPALVLAALVTSTVYASNDMSNRVAFDQRNLVGIPPDWIARATHAPTAYLYDGESYWNGVWQVTFWNPNVRDVLSILPTRVPGPLPQRAFSVPADGRLPIRERYIVASDPHTFVGTPVAHLDQHEIEVSGLTVWKLTGPPRLASVKSGIGPSGDMTEPAFVRAYDCGGGQLQLILLPKDTSVVTIKLNGRVVQRADIGGLPYWNGTVPVPPSRGAHVCTFEIDGQTLLGSTRIEFVHR